MNPLHIKQLEAMGIRVWVPRTAPAVDSSQALEPLSVPDGACVAVLVEAEADFQLDAAHPAGDLLLKILGALEAPEGSFAIYRLAAPLDDAGAIARMLGRAPETVLWFGDSQPDGAPGMLVLPCLQDMLEDPAAKKPAWARLKPLVGRIGGCRR